MSDLEVAAAESRRLLFNTSVSPVDGFITYTRGYGRDERSD
ncbi:MAG: hypothetical protein QF637_06850 [Acidimicrobiales bacterium]|nr:hypothetical protein [Acidimicrobiales bacterium]